MCLACETSHTDNSCFCCFCYFGRDFLSNSPSFLFLPMSLIIVHGGAASVPVECLESKLKELRLAAKKGFKRLLTNSESAAVDAVQASVELMENSPYFNAGFGSSLTSKGEVEMDAIMADGKQLDFGAVASVTRLRNPIVAARIVLDKSEHCLFVGDGAHDFASQNGLELVEPSSMVHEMAKAGFCCFVFEIYSKFFF